MKLNEVFLSPASANEAKTPAFKEFLKELKHNCSDYLSVTDYKHILWRGRFGGVRDDNDRLFGSDALYYGKRPIVKNKASVNNRFNYFLFDYAIELKFGIKKVRENSTYCSPDKTRAESFTSGQNMNYFFPMNGSRLLIGSTFAELDSMKYSFETNPLTFPDGRNALLQSIENLRKHMPEEDNEKLIELLPDNIDIVAPNNPKLFESEGDAEILVFDAPHYYIVNSIRLQNYSLLLDWIKDWA